MSDEFIHVAVTFRLPVTALAHYSANNIEEAVHNLEAWYGSGYANVEEDLVVGQDKAVFVGKSAREVAAKVLATTTVSGFCKHCEQAIWNDAYGRLANVHGETLCRPELGTEHELRRS